MGALFVLTVCAMKTLTLVPHGWPCKLVDCPPGLFSCENGAIIGIGFKSEYYQNEVVKMGVYCVDSGECFWGGAANAQERGNLIVQPVVLEWREL